MKKHRPATNRPKRAPDYTHNKVCHYWFKEKIYEDIGGLYYLRDVHGKLQTYVNGNWLYPDASGDKSQRKFEEYIEQILLGK